MRTVRFTKEAFGSAEKFHRAAKELLGFPAFYGMNWDAFIDCLSSADAPEEGMMTACVKPGGTLELAVPVRTGAVLAELTECVAAVNGRFAEAGRGTKVVVRIEP